MRLSVRLCDCLAALLAYPREHYAARLDAACRTLAGELPPAAAHLSALRDLVDRATLAELQEHFTRTFDLNPTCCPEVGWHLFGENYERGAFMVWVRASLRRLGLPESTELPDHLVHVLPLLGRLDPDEARAFSATCVQPAVSRMLDAFKGKDDPFEGVLRAIADVLAECFGPPRVSAVPLPVMQRHSESLVLLDGK